MDPLADRDLRAALEQVVVDADHHRLVAHLGVGHELGKPHLPGVGILRLQVARGRLQLVVPEARLVVGEGIAPPVVDVDRPVDLLLQAQDWPEGELFLHGLGDEGQGRGGVGAVVGHQVRELPRHVAAIGRQDLVDDEVHDLVDEGRVLLDLHDQVLEGHEVGGHGEGRAEAERRPVAGQLLGQMQGFGHHRHAPVARRVGRLQRGQVRLAGDEGLGIVEGGRHVLEEDQRHAQSLGLDVVDIPDEARRIEAVVARRGADALDEGLGVAIEDMPRHAGGLHGELVHLGDERHLRCPSTLHRHV